MDDNRVSKAGVVVNGEYGRLDNGSIRVNPKTCTIRFKPGRTYVYKIKLSNSTVRPQIIQIQQPENKLFTVPEISTVQSILPGGTWDLPISFTSRSNRESVSNLRLKNPTGCGDVTIVLRAIPQSPYCLPETIDFGNVDIGTRVTRKLILGPETNPDQFRIVIARGSKGLNVYPTCGRVRCDSPTYVTIVYTPQSYVTLCTDLVLYVSNDNRKPQVVTLTAVTKPKTNRFGGNVCGIKSVGNDVVTSVPKKVAHLPKRPEKRRDETEDNLTIFNRLTLNKMLRVNKPCTLPIDSYTWLDPLGDSDMVYRETYKKMYEDFMARAKRFGCEHGRESGFKIRACQSDTIEKQTKRDVTKAEWNTYKEKLSSYSKHVSSDHLQSESIGFRERSVRMNRIDNSDHVFDPEPDETWCIRSQTYNKFVNAIYRIIIKNRLEKRLDNFKQLILNGML